MKLPWRRISKAIGAAVGAGIFVAIKTKYPDTAGPIVDIVAPIIFPAVTTWMAPPNK